MEQKNLEKKEAGQVTAEKKKCIPEEALQMMHLLDKGTRQAFLDDELSLEDTKSRLDEIKKAYQRCEAGEVDACEVLDELVARLTRKPE